MINLSPSVFRPTYCFSSRRFSVPSQPLVALAPSSCARSLPCWEMLLFRGSLVRNGLCHMMDDLHLTHHALLELVHCLILCLDKQDVVCYTAVSGFVFLRFFAPAILNPKLFNLRHENPVSIIITRLFTWQTIYFLHTCYILWQSPIVGRTLTLISKSIQSLGNIASPKVLLKACNMPCVL